MYMTVYFRSRTATNGILIESTGNGSNISRDIEMDFACLFFTLGLCMLKSCSTLQNVVVLTRADSMVHCIMRKLHTPPFADLEAGMKAAYPASYGLGGGGGGGGAEYHPLRIVRSKKM